MKKRPPITFAFLAGLALLVVGIYLAGAGNGQTPVVGLAISIAGSAVLIRDALDLLYRRITELAEP